MIKDLIRESILEKHVSEKNNFDNFFTGLRKVLAAETLRDITPSTRTSDVTRALSNMLGKVVR